MDRPDTSHLPKAVQSYIAHLEADVAFWRSEAAPNKSQDTDVHIRDYLHGHRPLPREATIRFGSEAVYADVHIVPGANGLAPDVTLEIITSRGLRIVPAVSNHIYVTALDYHATTH